MASPAATASGAGSVSAPGSAPGSAPASASVSGAAAEAEAEASPLSTGQINDLFDLLPHIGELLSRMVSDSTSSAAEVSTKMQELKASLDRAEQLAETGIPGGEMSRSAQRERLAELCEVTGKKRAFVEAFVASTDAP